MVTMLVTRPEPDSSDTAARLAALGIDTLVDPLLTLETLPTSLPDAKGFAAMALTSANALRALKNRDALGHYTHLKLFAVGERTAEHARAEGFVDVEATGGDLGDMIEHLAHAGLTGPIFYPAAETPSGDLARSLAPFGLMVITTPIYRMIAAKALAATTVIGLAAGKIDAALFYSRRTAEIFAGLGAAHLKPDARLKLAMLCLSEAIAGPLIATHFPRIALADYPSEEAMLSLALSFARDQNRP